MSTIYVASKAKHGPKWIALRDQGWNINSTWIDVWDDEAIVDWATHWVKCIDEAAEADYCLAYSEPDETMKGALNEIGAALACGRRVIFVGDPTTKRYTVARHPLVTIVDTLEQALQLIEK